MVIFGRSRRLAELNAKLRFNLDWEREFDNAVREKEAMLATDVGEGVMGMVEIGLRAARRNLADTQGTIASLRRQIRRLGG